MSLILLIYCDPPTPVDPASGYLSWRSHPVHCQTNPSDRGHTPLLVPLASHQTPFASFLRSGRKTESVHIHRVIMGFPGGSLPLIQHPSPWASCAAMRGCGLPGPPGPIHLEHLHWVQSQGQNGSTASHTRDTKSRGPNTNFTQGCKKRKQYNHPTEFSWPASE
jgi:hypothetical protein